MPRTLVIETGVRHRYPVDVLLSWHHTSCLLLPFMLTCALDILMTAYHCLPFQQAARNVLLASGKKVGGDVGIVAKVADFGLSRGGAAAASSDSGETENTEEYYKSSTGIFPVRWTAPEAMETMRFTSASDMWSFGILIIEMVQDGVSPYHGMSNPDVMSLTMSGGQHHKPNECPERLFDIVTKCWHRDPAARHSFKGVTILLQHMFEDMQSNPMFRPAMQQRESVLERNARLSRASGANEYTDFGHEPPAAHGGGSAIATPTARGSNGFASTNDLLQSAAAKRASYITRSTSSSLRRANANATATATATANANANESGEYVNRLSFGDDLFALLDAPVPIVDQVASGRLVGAGARAHAHARASLGTLSTHDDESRPSLVYLKPSGSLVSMRRSQQEPLGAHAPVGQRRRGISTHVEVGEPFPSLPDQDGDSRRLVSQFKAFEAVVEEPLVQRGSTARRPTGSGGSNSFYASMLATPGQRQVQVQGGSNATTRRSTVGSFSSSGFYASVAPGVGRSVNGYGDGGGGGGDYGTHRQNGAPPSYVQPPRNSGEVVDQLGTLQRQSVLQAVNHKRRSAEVLARTSSTAVKTQSVENESSASRSKERRSSTV